jgi:hypothetical protein
MQRRDFIRSNALAAGSLLLPWIARAAAAPTIMHVIRIQLAPGISPALRARLLASVNRFKQIHAPSEFIVGQDVTDDADSHFDRTQISFLKGERPFYDYFNDPIHLAADREASSTTENAFAAVSSFDALNGGDASLLGRLNKILSDRDAKYRANDTRPTSPPVPDRPEDQKWNHGSEIFRVVRLDLSGLSDKQKTQRLATLEHCRAIKGVKSVFIGINNTQRNPQDRFTHDAFMAFENEKAYERYLAGPLHDSEQRADALLAKGSVQRFDVIDPQDDALAARLKALHASAKG